MRTPMKVKTRGGALTKSSIKDLMNTPGVIDYLGVTTVEIARAPLGSLNRGVTEIKT